MSRQPPWNFSNGAYRSRQFKIFVSQFPSDEISVLLDDLTTAVGAAAGAGSVGNRGGSAGAVHNGGGGHAIVGPAHTLLGMRLLILLYGHDGTP